MDSPARDVIAILEDDPDRTFELLACLQNRLPDYKVIVFDDAPEMIRWLAGHLQELRLVCLDHDLGPNRLCDGQLLDPGTGRDVADYLARHSPVCPVLLHTTNTLAVPGMELVLGDAGWLHSRVTPHNGLEWVQQTWIEKVAEMLEGK